MIVFPVVATATPPIITAGLSAFDSTCFMQVERYLQRLFFLVKATALNITPDKLKDWTDVVNILG